MLPQEKRGIAPEDQVPPEYREVEQWAYKEHYGSMALPPTEVLSLGAPGDLILPEGIRLQPAEIARGLDRNGQPYCIVT